MSNNSDISPFNAKNVIANLRAKRASVGSDKSNLRSSLGSLNTLVSESAAVEKKKKMERDAVKLTMKDGSKCGNEEADFYKMLLQSGKGMNLKEVEPVKETKVSSTKKPKVAAKRKKSAVDKNDSDSSWSDFDEEEEEERALAFSSTPRKSRAQQEEEEEEVRMRMGLMKMTVQDANPYIPRDDEEESEIEDSDDDLPIVFKHHLTNTNVGKEYSCCDGVGDDGVGDDGVGDHGVGDDGVGDHGEESDDLDDISFGDSDDGGGSVVFKGGGGAEDESFGRLSDDEEPCFDEDDNFIPKHERQKEGKEAEDEYNVNSKEAVVQQHEDDVDDIFAEYERRLAAVDVDDGGGPPRGARAVRRMKKEMKVATEIPREHFSASLPSPLEFKEEGGATSRTMRGRAVAERKGSSSSTSKSSTSMSNTGKFVFDPKTGKTSRTAPRNGRAVGNPKKDEAKFVF